MLCSNWDPAYITWRLYTCGYKSINLQPLTSCDVIRWNRKKKKKKIQHMKSNLGSRVCGYRCAARISWILFKMKMAEWSLWIWLSTFGSQLKCLVEQQPSAQPNEQVLVIAAEKRLCFILCLTSITAMFQHILDGAGRSRALVNVGELKSHHSKWGLCL